MTFFEIFILIACVSGIGLYTLAYFGIPQWRDAVKKQLEMEKELKEIRKQQKIKIKNPLTWKL